MLAGAAGIWLFYVQHQFEGVYWESRERGRLVTFATAREGAGSAAAPLISSTSRTV